MAPINLTFEEMFNGVLITIMITIWIIISILMMRNYKKEKNPVALGIGLTFIFLSASWWMISFNFILISFSNGNYFIPDMIYVIFGIVLNPLAILALIYSFTTLTYPQLKKKILTIYIIISILFAVYLIIGSSINFDLLIGYKVSALNSSFRIGPIIFAFFFVLTYMISGVMVGIKLVRSNDEIIRLKGRFIIISFILLSFCIVFDTFFDNIIVLTFIRIGIITGVILSYFGFFLPEKVASWLTTK